jgi:hypothetical protein
LPAISSTSQSIADRHGNPVTNELNNNHFQQPLGIRISKR